MSYYIGFGFQLNSTSVYINAADSYKWYVTRLYALTAQNTVFLIFCVCLFFVWYTVLLLAMRTIDAICLFRVWRRIFLALYPHSKLILFVDFR